MRHFGFKLEGTTASRVVYHFPEAKQLELRHVGVQGTIFAPLAKLTFEEGVVHGDVNVCALVGNGQVNVQTFEGCLPTPCQGPCGG